MQAWNPLEDLLEKYPPELRQMVLSLKWVMLNVEDVSDEACLVSMGAELGAIVATMKYVRNPAQKHDLFRKILIRLKGDKSEEVEERVTASVTCAAVIKALARGKLTIEEIAEDNSVSVDDVLKIQAEMQS